MIQHSHRTLQSLYQAALQTDAINLTPEQFYSRNLKDLQLYDFNGLQFFRACNQLWELMEDTGRFRVINPIKTTERIWYLTGVTL